ncbi:MAG: HAD family hydrolase [Selenomonadaceae bacterium]|nr:HAD family hydrolase [Selenomonadaceae bacterium]
MNRAVFFDRDGVLNIDTINLYKIEDWVWIDGAREAIKYCNDNGWLAIIITNQSGIARGLFTEADVDKLHNFVQAELKKVGAHLDGIYICPHHVEGTVEPYNIECDCRKPKPGLILRACEDFDIDPKQSYMIGDKQRDVDAGLNAGCKGYLFDGKNLLDAVKEMLGNG